VSIKIQKTLPCSNIFLLSSLYMWVYFVARHWFLFMWSPYPQHLFFLFAFQMAHTSRIFANITASLWGPSCYIKPPVGSSEATQACAGCAQPSKTVRCRDHSMRLACLRGCLLWMHWVRWEHFVPLPKRRPWLSSVDIRVNWKHVEI